MQSNFEIPSSKADCFTPLQRFIIILTEFFDESYLAQQEVGEFFLDLYQSNQDPLCAANMARAFYDVPKIEPSNLPHIQAYPVYECFVAEIGDYVSVPAEGGIIYCRTEFDVAAVNNYIKNGEQCRYSTEQDHIIQQSQAEE